MTATSLSKAEVLSHFHDRVRRRVDEIGASSSTREENARLVNRLVNETKTALFDELQLPDGCDRQLAKLIIQYCYSVVSLEYRHRVWPYEYMAFSRRVGELWEQFCSAAWDYPTRDAVKRIAPPEFEAVRGVLRRRIEANIAGNQNRDILMSDVVTLFDLVGDINMREDEVFAVNSVPHVVDFKSGFGSNEKGNMLRLQSVGQAYRLWNPETNLLLLVRQETNNNYLSVLKRMGLWSVHTGSDAYKKISELTGADMQWIRETIIDWPRDLSPEFLAFLKRQPRDLTTYLAW